MTEPGREPSQPSAAATTFPFFGLSFGYCWAMVLICWMICYFMHCWVEVVNRVSAAHVGLNALARNIVLKKAYGIRCIYNLETVK